MAGEESSPLGEYEHALLSTLMYSDYFDMNKVLADISSSKSWLESAQSSFSSADSSLSDMHASLG